MHHTIIFSATSKLFVLDTEIQKEPKGPKCCCAHIQDKDDCAPRERICLEGNFNLPLHLSFGKCNRGVFPIHKTIVIQNSPQITLKSPKKLTKILTKSSFFEQGVPKEGGDPPLGKDSKNNPLIFFACVPNWGSMSGILFQFLARIEQNSKIPTASLAASTTPAADKGKHNLSRPPWFYV